MAKITQCTITLAPCDGTDMWKTRYSRRASIYRLAFRETSNCCSGCHRTMHETRAPDNVPQNVRTLRHDANLRHCDIRGWRKSAPRVAGRFPDRYTGRTGCVCARLDQVLPCVIPDTLRARAYKNTANACARFA